MLPVHVYNRTFYHILLMQPEFPLLLEPCPVLYIDRGVCVCLWVSVGVGERVLCDCLSFLVQGSSPLNCLQDFLQPRQKKAHHCVIHSRIWENPSAVIPRTFPT